jgi:hypothetical protein
VSKIILGVLIGLALAAAGAVVYVRYPEVANFLKAPEADPTRSGAAGQAQDPQAPAEESFLQHDPNGHTTVKLDQDAQTRMGLKVVSLTAAIAPSEVRGFGRVLDSAPLAALVTERASAQAALQASTKEYERVKTLYSQDQNASARALETAEAAKNKDQIALESVQWRLLAGWGKEIASRADLPAFVTSLAARQAALIRVDVPLGDHPKAPPVGGRIAPVGAPENVIEAQILGPAPNIDPQAQTEGYLFLVGAGPRARPDEGQPQGVAPTAFAPGAALVAWLAVPGRTRTGVIVPRDAVLRHEGETFVYLQTLDDAFQRKAVALERPLGTEWFVEHDLKPQEKVVVVGAQQLLSEELKAREGGE